MKKRANGWWSWVLFLAACTALSWVPAGSAVAAGTAQDTAPPKTAIVTPSAPGGVPPAPEYRFTTDWFSHNIPVWNSVLAPYKGKPGLRYLEVGVYEGRSLLWVMDHVFTHPTCEFTGIDIEISKNLLANLEASGRKDHVTTIHGSSQVELKKLPLQSFDVIYVDGSHTADDVLADAVLSWELLKVGGLVIFDDYQWDGAHHTGDGSLPPELLPGPAIASFIRSYRHEIDVIHNAYQVVVRKKDNPCGEIKGYCSPLGKYVYDWKKHRLFLPGRFAEPVEISSAERRMIESILRSGSIAPEIRSDPEFLRMRERLGLE